MACRPTEAITTRPHCGTRHKWLSPRAAPGIVPLPHARKRLKLADHVRVQLMSRRFPEARCIALDPGSRITWDGKTWKPSITTMQLAKNGEVVEAAGGRV